MPPPSALTRSMLLRRDGLRVIEEPSQLVDRHVAMHALEHVEEARDRFVVGGVQPERPSMLGQVANHPLEFRLHRRREIRAGLEKVFEVRRRERQHLAGAVQAVGGIALVERADRGPALEIGELLLRPLREQVVGDPQRQLTGAVQAVDRPDSRRDSSEIRRPRR